MTGPIKILLIGEAANHHDRLAAALTVHAEIRTAPQPLGGDASIVDEMDRTDVVIALRIPPLAMPATGFRLLQVPGAGLDAIDFASIPRNAWICNVFEHETPIAEYVMLAMLHHTFHFDSMRREFTPKSWASLYRERRPHDELFGKTIGIRGFGRIGRQIALRARAFGMHILAATGAAEEAAQFVDVVLPPDRLDEMLAEAAFVVVACPLTSATRGLIDERRFQLMRPDAVLISVSRAEIIEEAALFAALRDHTIAAAYLDVWYRYPRPSEKDVPPASLPFHDLPNAFCTPHSSAWTTQLFERRYREIARNIERLVRGEPLLNVVRAPQAGEGI